MDDKKTLGLNHEVHSFVEALVSSWKWFPDQQSAGRFCFAYALVRQQGADPIQDVDDAPRTTVWNVGTIDSDGTMRQLLAILGVSEEASYRMVEDLMNLGATLLQKRLSDNPSVGLWDIIREQQGEGPSPQ